MSATAMFTNNSTALLQGRITAPRAAFRARIAPALPRRGRVQITKAGDPDKQPPGDLDNDSYQQVEADVRGSPPDQGPPIRERQTELDRQIVDVGQREKTITGSDNSIADSFRFKGALPEVANSRLAMLGFVAALGYEALKGKSLLVQINEAPGLIVATFVLFTVATAVPILRGEKRTDASEWGGLPGFTANAEIINGRTAMIGFLGLVLTEALKGGPLLGQ
eukprot:CAMPEP_0206148780 /NCGR_PEP_ID=MMETSP1473-20131121/37433_1 /ASSEMBLY_ACC=CAM_ASM_001109 /TAXON_ID=1461547 /ORGANISM="Stichococcus sp, Strain RCC1054" /LENGTH=221 /DNA_ID=CAMNT_0053546203 /DNA_START=101 /DNA_END=766 /DNA_ORIENTATION=+